jgi:hypothetical protein
MIYEFECAKGHVTEAMVPMGTEAWPCEACIAEMKARHAANPNVIGAFNPIAKRIMSATRTTFVFADTGKRMRHVKESAKKMREINHR